MSIEYAGARYWLLDFFGDIVEHDLMRDRLHSAKPTPGQYPGIFFYAQDIDSAPFDVDLRKAVSLPVPLPPLRAISIPGQAHIIALQRRDGDQRYMRSIHNGHLDFMATTPDQWEYFLPLSEQMLHSFAILGQEKICAISHEDGRALPPLELIWHHRGRIGEYEFSLGDNIQTLEEVSSLPAGQEAPLELKTDSESLRLKLRRL
ncbi:hypothetical protein [Kozakia baliensis]|uniref:Uncharacterized protein n=1 Tax=Kozakia baliensis TaxID=153496 RepID=A0A1D8UW22_9PROT|nr:hypothetical protein [Kozakia baliensis]AOX17829.1 hypothetical protein A0U89_12530 [Kozakia baliensis]GBR33570.1 hypothetical protein AA0488_2734 [Kozakia baliensis NRIC 0488]GEL64913.1 hypothetical protein KBA01_21990 [Kozakia baliensis]